MKMKLLLILLMTITLIPSVVLAQQGRYVSLSEFLDKTFPSDESHVEESKPYKTSTLWLKEGQKQVIKDILGHDYVGFRIRYWNDDQRTAWILEEVGKEHPITMGVVVEDQKIADFSILEFRESRGWEIKYDFFTQQFSGLAIKTNKKNKIELSKPIDGITGATLSVRATKKIAKLALYLDQQIAAMSL
ncbi:MAG: FMN-binding protein [Cellvibrionaceae bacterium]